MKNLKFMIVALVAMLGFTACDNNGKDFIEVDYSKDIVGTWTCLEADHSAVYIFNADGTLSTTGVDSEGYWENVNGTYNVVNNKITMSFETGRNINGSFDIIPGHTLSIVGEKGRHTYNYCKEDLSDEVLGMWVCTQTDLPEANMTIQTYKEDGSVVVTGFSPNSNSFVINGESTYKVVGNLMIQKTIGGMGVVYFPTLLTYTPNATSLGDVLSTKGIVLIEGEYIEATYSWLRIKQNLDLANKEYDYNNIYVTNVKGEDKEFEFAGQTLNFSTLDGTIMDKMMKNILFNVSFPATDRISYNCYYNGKNVPIEAPIVVEGNKVTVRMSVNNPVYRDIDVYTFQDADDCQMHMYMPTYSFVNFFANISAVVMAKNGELDVNDANAVAELYNKIDNAVESINVSFIFKAKK